MIDRETRYFFCHLQKTGGLALTRRLGHHFPDSAIYPDGSDGEPPARTVSIPHLLDRWTTRRHDVRVVCGHYPLCTTELLGGGFRTFTILRDPVERVLSSLRHHWRAHPDRRGMTLEEVYADEMRYVLLLDNHMVRMLSLTVDEMDDGMYSQVTYDEARLDRAKAALDGIDVVGLQEDYDRFIVDLERAFGWDLGDPVVSNVTAPADAPQALRERIAADSRYDVELYEYATTLVPARRSAASVTPPGGAE